MDKYYGNVCELDIIFNFQKAYFILDELLIAGEMQETSKKNVLRCISQQDSLEDMEVSLECFLSFCFHLTLGIIHCHFVFLQRTVQKGGYVWVLWSIITPYPLATLPVLTLFLRSAMAKFSQANYFRLRKTWSPRSCNTMQAGLLGVHRSFISILMNTILFRNRKISVATWTQSDCDYMIHGFGRS
jgi:hypothetical protein